MDPSLFLAATDGNVETLLNLLQVDPLILERSATSATADSPLHIAAMLGHLGIVIELLKHKRDVHRYVEELNQHGFSSIHMASANGHVEVVRELLKISRELCSLKGKDGMTALHCAAVKGRVEVINLILESYPETVTDVTATCETALHLAVKNNQVEALEMLIKLVKDYHLDLVEIINSMDEEGNTVLHLAASRKNRLAIKLLLNCDNPTPGILEVNAINKSGLTPLDVFLLCSCESMYPDMERLFMNSGAKRSSNIRSNRIPAAASATNQTPTTTVVAGDVNGGALTRDDILNWEKYFKFQVDKSDPDKARGDLLVVSVLMATATYQAMVTPPDTFKNKGENTMGFPFFVLFALFNSAGFYMSLYIILFLTHSHPLNGELTFASTAMYVTYACFLHIITPPGRMLFFSLTITILMPPLIGLAIPQIKRWYKRRWAAGRTYQRNHGQNALNTTEAN